ncbi:MAG: hemolysin family protein [Lachnospiraceae bacterium]
MDDDNHSVFRFLKPRNKKQEEAVIEEEIMSMVNDGHEHGYIQSDEVEMISNIFTFGEKEAKEIMTFRQKIIGVDVSMPLEEAILFMLEQSYSRFPLYEEDLDHIVGVLHLKDAVRYYIQKQDVSLKEIARPAYFVHDTIHISDLLKKMQAEKIHMALVLDEYGQTDGIIAMEDILEVIVGEIFDEYDEEEEEITKLSEADNYLIQGMTRLDELEELLHIEFPEDDFETVNGFLLYKLGHLPEDDEEIDIHYGGYSFKPIDIHEKMIKQIKVSKIKEEN